MDIRETEEFKKTQAAKIQEAFEKEISAVNILKNMRRSEELRSDVYKDSHIGDQPITYSFVAISGLFVIYTTTNKFRKFQPKFYAFIGKSMIPRVLIILLAARLGVTLETYSTENIEKPIDFQNYISSYNYTESLLQKRLETLSYSKRFELSTGYKIDYFNKWFFK